MKDSVSNTTRLRQPYARTIWAGVSPIFISSQNSQSIAGECKDFESVDDDVLFMPPIYPAEIMFEITCSVKSKFVFTI